MPTTPSNNRDEKPFPEEMGEDELDQQPDDIVPVDEGEEGEPNVYVIGHSEPAGPAQDQLAAAKAQADEYKDLAQRARAELINYRKRVEAERADSQKYAIEQLITDLLPALDSLTQAEQLYAATPDGENPLLDGMRKTLKQIHKVFAQHGVEAFGDANIPFDGNLHMALMIDESPDVKAPTVVEVYQQGIRIGERVIKPAMVRVLTPTAGQATGSGCGCGDAGGGDGGG